MDLISQSDSFNGLCTGSSSISHFRQVFLVGVSFFFPLASVMVSRLRVLLILSILNII